MSAFDPYHLWLGIPPHDQPPNHYRLLGVPAFETNPAVIEAAADRQMGHLRNYQAGPHAAESQRLLNEVAAARVCLLNPAKRAAYDAALRDAQVDDSAEEDWTVETAAAMPPAARRRPSGSRAALTLAGILAFGFAGLGLAIWAMKAASEHPGSEYSKTAVNASRPLARNNTKPTTNGISPGVAEKQRTQETRDDGLPQGWFRMVNRNSGLALGVRSASLEPKTDIIQWTTGADAKDAHWSVVRMNGHFLIRNRNSGQFLFVADAAANPGTGIWQLPDTNGSPFGYWAFERLNDGFYKITSESTGQALSMAQASATPGTGACMWPFSMPGIEQQWKLESVE